MAKKIYVKDVEPLIDKHRGNIAAIARELGVGRATVWRRIKESAGLQQKLEDARETMLDNAESVLYGAVLAGKTAELIFFLKTQGSRRGWVERHEVSGPGGRPLEHKVKLDEPDPEFIASVIGILAQRGGESVEDDAADLE